MMKAIDLKQNNTESSYNFIAFSGDWKGHYFNTVSPENKGPNSSQTEAYLDYLHSLGFVNCNKEKTFILEFPHYCGGVTSFQEIINNKWLPSFNVKKSHFLLSEPLFQQPNNEIPESILPFTKTQELQNFIFRLGNCDSFDDRLVMQYKYMEWETKTPLTFQPSRSAKLLRQIIYAYVDKKFKNSSSRLFF